MMIVALPSLCAAVEYTEVEWTDLMPKDDLDALLAPPEYLNDIADGSQQDSVAALNQKESVDAQTKRYRDALSSTRVMQEFNGKQIRIPGYMVPLEQNEEREVTAFFIVPYFGACLHMPPPPPNQILYVQYEEGIALEALQQPFWFEGTLTVALNENALGTSAYTLNIDDYRLYE
ncbi:MAG TPA: DUF3299 domain-containing protein [Alteromonas sp.]|nr:hypothetical protein [Alteromonadaceae bacterium]MAX43245.1 hypothetical protein [Alteromonadaceae bacterium]HBY41868.1 DUF3299 domain-containing protein [Alteromonas sp.]